MSEGPEVMRVLLDRDVDGGLENLDRAWEQAPTFVFAPEKSGLSRDQLERALSRLPANLRSGHFALLTSGSTGRPSVVVGVRSRSEALVGVLHELQESDPVAETILALPLTYSYAFVNQWLWARRHGRRLVATRGFADVAALGEALRRADQAMLCLVGVQVPLLLRYFRGARFPGVIRLHFAGGRFPQESLDELGGMFPTARVFNNYGCAQAMPRLTLRKAEDADEASDVGFALPGVELRTDAEQQLVFRSPFGAVAVVEGEELALVGPNTWLPTGDLGQRTEGGSWRLIGRASEVFKRHGEKVSLPALSTAIHARWPGQAAFYRERDPSGEEGHVLVLAPPPEEAELRELLRVLRAQFPRSHWPLRVEGLENLPILPNGKVDVASIPAKQRTVHWYQRI